MPSRLPTHAPMMPVDATEAVDALRARLDRCPADRYPIQRATMAFHLGTTLISGGGADEAVSWLQEASRLFPRDAMPVEHAKAIMMLGVALRDTGAWEGAADHFARAAEVFAAAGQELEEAASRHNLGLALRDGGHLTEAAHAFATALATFAAADARAQATMAARELGSVQLATGDLTEAVGSLEQAVDLALRAGDRAALGAAANALGVAHLAADQPDRARAAFEDALGAHPRTIRPAEHAMARSNLALACDRAGRGAHAVLAARQALAVVEVDAEVVAQATDVLERLGDDAAALVRVLEAEPSDRHVAILRSELARVAAVPADRARHDRAWVEALAEDAGRAPGWAEAWLEVVLEQPPEAFMETVRGTVAAVAALGPDDAAAVRHAVSRAMVRFHVPQWTRLREAFDAEAARIGVEGGWG